MTMEEIAKELNRLEERRKMKEMKEAKMIEEAVVIMHPKQKKIVAGLGIKHVIFSEAIEEDKIYLVTDEAVGQTIRDYQDNFGIIERSEE